MSSEFLFTDRATINKIIPQKKKLEGKLKVKIITHDNQLELEGDEVDIYTARKIIEAIERTFSVDDALLLIQPDYVLEDIKIKDVTKKKNLEVVRSRIIGTEGRTIQILGELSDSHVVLHNNVVSIIGTFEKIKDTINAVRGIIQGSKQANIYKYLEKARKRERPESLDIKEE